MIINVLRTKGYANGYLKKETEATMVQSIFPTANMAIRKQVLAQVGGFDTACKTSGEDVDMCIRVAKTQWELFFEPKAVIYHKHRTTFKGLLKQWYGYGTYHPHVFKKNTPCCLEICYRKPVSKGATAPDTVINWAAKRFYKVFGIPVPFRALIFITPFHIQNIFLLIMIIGLIIRSHTFAFFGLGGWILCWMVFCGKDFFRNVILRGNLRWIIYSVMRYLLNWAFISGAFWAGMKIGVLHIDITREQTPRN